ncbi:MAG: SIS domain-containing protein [Actinomycetota bacterium]
MCGIVAVVRRPNRRPPPSAGQLLGELEAAHRSLLPADADLESRLAEACSRLGVANDLLRGAAGALALIKDPDLPEQISKRTDLLGATVDHLDRSLYGSAHEIAPETLERVRVRFVAVRDLLWAIDRDRLRTGLAVCDLCGSNTGRAAIEAYTSIQAALSALDRMEVRGRDSAGVHVMVFNHGLDWRDPEVQALAAPRWSDGLFKSGALRCGTKYAGFVYKAAAEIGELGDNVAAIRKSIAGDDLLRMALGGSAYATVLGHTRWASVGTVSEPNAHPLDGLEEDSPEGWPHVVGVLNGDIDNYASLVDRHKLRFPDMVTTDAKVIPVMTARRVAGGEDPKRAFAGCVNELEGSMAIVANCAEEPEGLMLAVRGSGQALYIGMAEDSFVVASEPYGVVEDADRYLRMDGDATTGRLVFLDGEEAGSLEGVDRRGYDWGRRSVTKEDVAVPQITTRDIDRQGFAHFLLKEISESPTSFCNTLRGRIVEEDGHKRVRLGSGALPEIIKRKLADRAFSKAVVIGQGTAAVAGQAVAAAVAGALEAQGVAVSALTASEFSGFSLRDDMSDTLVIAVSQSGTTTDTNRTVDLVKGRGASVLAIVNRRNTELGEKVDGVLHTSDGRDVEMSVASTKAFYAQVAAGFLLGLAIADAAGSLDAEGEGLLEALERLPVAMEQVLDRRELISAVASRHASRRRHWAVVGNGDNKIAAAEVRIKLSELCYKSVACDSTEDKKHIDLSAEPLILVCAAGINGAMAEDVQREVAIYRAHKAAPIVIASDGQDRFDHADTISVPEVHPKLDFILSAMVGHLFGYEAALAIDALALPLRQIRVEVQELAGAGLSAASIVASLPERIEPFASSFLDSVNDGACDGVISLGKAMRLGLLLRCAIGEIPFEVYELERGSGVSPKVFLDEFVGLLTFIIDDLTRSIDAVKHQAKTVTVGISRSEDGLFGVPLVKRVMALGPRTEQLGYRALRALAALDPAVQEVVGYTRYGIQGDPSSQSATIHVLEQQGIAAKVRSRTETDPRLRGTKRAALEKAEVEVTIGRSDNRPVILIPERKGDEAQGLTLLHVKFVDRLPAVVAREVLAGYKSARLEALIAAVTETEEQFSEERLGELAMPELLVEPVLSLAEKWRR